MSEIKPIQTRYKNYHFRSRLEARWAVFFDALGIAWKYEDEGYKDTDSNLYYLPDFYLPNMKTFVEVKGNPKEIKEKVDFYSEILDYGGILPGGCENLGTTSGLLFLGNIPDPVLTGIVVHPIIQHHGGLYLSWAMFSPGWGGSIEVFKDTSLSELIGVSPSECIEYDPKYWVSEPKVIDLNLDRNYTEVINAYRAARSARFEHGQNGAT